MHSLFYNCIRWIVCFIFLYNIPLIAQNKKTTNPPNFNASYLSSDPKLDGNIITDPTWAEIKPITNLSQARPFYGFPASEKTEIRIAFTNKTLYVGVICFDKEPEKIVVSDSRRDSNLDDDDSFLFILDTYNDQQNGFLFGTNSIGVEYDAQIDNEGEGNLQQGGVIGGVIGGTNLNWDASWEVKTETGKYGWSAEFAIPLRTLRFGNGNNKTWGINFQRNISKTSEIAYWAPLPIAFEIKRLSLAGKMNGINLKKPKNLKIFPYALTRSINDKSNNSKSNNQEFGVDLKYSLTPGLTLDMTYNTDFAQVEVDEQQVNLDRFNLFFPEKRAFFLENAGQFSVGSPGEVDLFFSRRIGLSDDGSVIPIKGGSRISGKIGQTNVGLLNMYTDEVRSDGIHENNFSVARVNHDFTKSRSSIGGIYINKSQLGSEVNNYNRVLALDGKWGIGKKAQITGFLSKSSTPNITSKDHALNLKAEYAWDGWRIHGAYTEVGEGFNPEVGFLLREAFKKPEFLIFKQWRPKNTENFLEVRPHISGHRYLNFNNDLISSFLHIDNHWVWKSGFEIHTAINFTTEGVLEDFPISGVTITEGKYNHKEFALMVFTNKNNQIYYTSRTVVGGYYGGDRFSSNNTVNMRFGDRFNSALTVNYNKLNLENGSINALITGGKFTYSFTPRIYLQSLIQYNNISNITSINARFGWLKNANTGLFIVLNLIKDEDFIDRINNQVVTIKYNYQFDILNNK